MDVYINDCDTLANMVINGVENIAEEYENHVPAPLEPLPQWIWDPSLPIEYLNKPFFFYPLPDTLSMQNKAMQCPFPCPLCASFGPHPPPSPQEQMTLQEEKAGNAMVESDVETSTDLDAFVPEVNFCKLCRSNREPEAIYLSHVLKDEDGKPICPALRSLVCILCGGTEDNAHTLKFCPMYEEARVPCRLRSLPLEKWKALVARAIMRKRLALAKRRNSVSGDNGVTTESNEEIGSVHMRDSSTSSF